jgi:hypothetical protein
VTVKQLFETYVYAEILSSVDLLPFVITGLDTQAYDNAAALSKQPATLKRLVEEERLTQKNAANRRGIEGAVSARNQA